MKQTSIWILILFCWQQAFTQVNASFTINGIVADSTNHQTLNGATVLLLLDADTSTVAYSTTDKGGKFKLIKVPAGSFSLLISYTGYRHYQQKLELSNKETVLNLDSIFLVPDTSTLEGVVVSRPPVSVKNDTVEFRANAFKTQPNATAEDLLKKLPGMEVDKDGNITAQGEEITRIYVDGKEFFSNDPKLATKNLNADLIESIQVFDDMSEQAKFTRIDDGSRIRTINIKLKKDRKKGMFGKATAGAGTSDRYTGALSANAFSDDRQLSLLGGGNNINRMGFTQYDLEQSLSSNNRNRTGQRTGNAPAAGDGNTQNWNAGINFRDQWGTKGNMGGSYFVSDSKLTTVGNSYRQNFFPGDSVSLVTQHSMRQNDNQQHNLNLRFEYNIDTMNSVVITPNIRFGKTEWLNLDSSLTEADGKSGRYLAIVGVNRRAATNDNLNLTNNLLYRHRFDKIGRTFTIGWTTTIPTAKPTASTHRPTFSSTPTAA